VQVSYDDVEYLYGAEGYVIKVEKNPFTDGKEETVAKYLGNKLIGMTFRTFDASVLENPLYEPFDVVNAFDRKGNMYPTIINSVSYKIGGYTQISCKAESPVRNESSYTNEAANALVQAKKNTKKELTTYEKAVQSMNQLAMNAMGFYSSEEKLEDGSTIAYIHNKPNREESSTIYKMTSDGFFISQDGGKSYTAGFDSAGNAVLNILSAIGIQFDWAKGGILSLGGYDNVNGQIFIYNANGVQVGTINNNGIVFYSDESKRQIVISPVTGFYQRDSEGNEFYGLSYDATVHLPQYTPYVNGESRQSVVRVSRKDGIDDDIITSKYLYINQYSENGIEKSKYNIRATYEHSYAYWKTTETTEFYNKNKTTVKIQLPDSFKGKEWIVTLIYKGINIERKKDYKYLEYYYYNEKLPLCYEGEYLDSGEIIRLGWVTSIPGEFYTTETNLMLNRVGHTTTYLSLPEVTSGYANIQSSIGDEIKEYDYTYTTDEENGTITITGYATDGKYYINELMDIRVLVTC
jgi:preprotein translocase subunit Sss1